MVSTNPAHCCEFHPATLDGLGIWYTQVAAISKPKEASTVRRDARRGTAAQVCALCSELCEACSGECESHDMDHCKACAAACRRCSDECRRMAPEGYGAHGREGKARHAH